MPNALTLFTLAISFLPTVVALNQATAQPSSRVPVAVDSSRQIDTTIHAHADSLAQGAVQSDDTLGKNGSATLDSTAIDTLGRMSTPSLVGTYDHSLEKSKVLTKNDLHWLGYQYLGGILESVPGTYVRDQNSVGQYNQLNIGGVDWRGIAITMDGRLLNDPASGIFNLFHFTTEYADRIEVITGPRAFIYALNSTGGAINLLTKNYNSNRPYTKVNYSETAYNAVYSDGTFSQNISRKLNFTFGFQHQGTDGRVPNSAHDAWNGRVKVRYNFSKDFNIILSEYHTSTSTQLNGGVNYMLAGPPSGITLYPPKIIKNLDASEKITRNDVDLSFVGTFLGDTANVSMLTVYYSHSIREYRDSEDPLQQSTNGVHIESDHITSWMGARFAQNFDTEFQQFNLGGNIELRQIEASPNLGHRRNVIGSVWAKEELLLSDRTTVAAFGRYDRYLKKSYAGIGGDAKAMLSDDLSVFAGASLSRRMPTYQELYWTDSTVTRSTPIKTEKHLQVEAGTQVKLSENSFVRASYFHRTIEDAIQIIPYQTQVASPFPTLEFTTQPKIIMNGFEVKLGVRFWVLYLEGVGTYLVQTSDGINTQLFPRAWANGGIYYWNTLFQNKLELKVGFRGRYQSSLWGAEFNPEVLAYVPNTTAALGQAGSGDFFIGAHIGDAYIQLIWGNLTSVQYYSTPFYPILERALRIGVSWEFLD